MAQRPVYVSIDRAPYVKRTDMEFKFYSGFSLAQKQRCIDSLHVAFRETNPDARLLEISSKSPSELGIKLSAFNLRIILKSGKSFSLESAFQGSKVFENGGAYTDLLYKSSREAKKDPRLKTSGNLKAFKYFGREFPLEPKTYFYNWLYVNALSQHQDLAKEVLQFDAFTDIEFNPKKSLNCQAEAVAIFVGLSRANLLDEALKDKDTFLKIVY